MSKIKDNYKKKLKKEVLKTVDDGMALKVEEIMTFFEARFSALTEMMVDFDKKVKGNETYLPIKVLKVNEDAPDLFYKEKRDSGLDISSMINIEIPPHGEVLLPAGIVVVVPLNYEIMLRPKSSNKKFLIRLGTIDNGYRGEIKISVVNPTNKAIKIDRLVPIAQLVINKLAFAKRIDYVDSIKDLPISGRGIGGFGSTDDTISIELFKLKEGAKNREGIADLLEEFSYELPYKVDQIIIVEKFYLMKDTIKAVVKLNEGVKHSEKNIFIIDNKKKMLFLDMRDGLDIKLVDMNEE